MSTPDENTQGRQAARRALADSRRASVRADKLIEDAGRVFAGIRADRETNHFADKFRAIIKGAA